ncbi:SPFH domain-containing protein [Nonomuraea sp. LPB2021202275-12-8]|uniref:SPFH domain-containing protein n=1 Tax=Nonomuraea sp. LPB2021202275-12-8 TaxID=3120159 RepID=UPI00300D555F
MRAEPPFGRRLIAALARWDDTATPSAQPDPAESGGSFGRRLLGALARWDDEPREFAVPVGMTGVAVTPGAVLSDVLREGTAHQLDPDITEVVLVPARPLILEWRQEHEPDAYDAALEPVVVIVQGFRLHIEMSAVLRIPARAAPALVRDFGDAPVQRFVERVLATAVNAYFMEISTGSALEKFLVDYQRVLDGLETRINEALASWEVEALTITVGAANSQDPALIEALRQIVAAEVEGRALSIVTEEEIRLTEVVHDSRQEQRRMEELVLRQKIQQLGANRVAAEVLLRTMAEMQVPEYFSNIGGDVSALLTGMPLAKAQAVVERTLRETAVQRSRADEDTTAQVQPEPHVEWILDRRNDHFVLRNVGSAIATGVNVSGPGLAEADAHVPANADIGPGAWVIFIIAANMTHPVPNEIEVTWDGHPEPVILPVPPR